MPVIFSNADREMISTKDLNEHSQGFEVFRDIICVDATRYFKPLHLAESMSKGKIGEDTSKMWLVSANPFDIVGAVNVDMETVWVDRDGEGWKVSLFLRNGARRQWLFAR